MGVGPAVDQVRIGVLALPAAAGAAPADDKLASLAARMERVAEKWEQVPGEQMPLVANDFRYMAKLLRKAVGA
jgi:hypothetical protein